MDIVGDIDIVGPTLGDSVQILVIKFCPPPVIYDDVDEYKHAATQTSLLSSTFNDVNNLLLHKVDGIVPDKELPFKLSDTILDSIPSDVGMIPTSLFDCRFKYVNLLNSPRDEGIVPPVLSPVTTTDNTLPLLLPPP